MLVGIEGESEGDRVSIAPSGGLTVNLRVHRVYCQLFSDSSNFLQKVVSVFRNPAAGYRLTQRRTSSV